MESIMEKDDVEAQLDLDSKKVLKAIDEYGESSITEIKQRVGKEKYIVSYRLEKLEDEGLIEIEKRERENNVGTIRWARVSDKGRTLIQQGLLLNLEEEEKKQNPMFNENRMEEVENKVENMERRIGTLVDDVSKMNTKEEEVKEMKEEVEKLREDVDGMQDWLKEWTKTQEKYLEGLKNIVDEEFDKDFQDYTPDDNSDES